MRLEGIEAGDIVEVDRLGRRFLAFVLGPAPGGLSLQPVDRRISYHSCRARDVLRALGQARAPASERGALGAVATSARARHDRAPVRLAL